jgi:hypothetical protein
MRADDPRLEPVIWILIVGTFVLVVSNADSSGELAAQLVVFGVFVAIYVLVIRPRARR